jgi:hypothetical protein
MCGRTGANAARFAANGDEVVHGLACERLLALRDEEPGQCIRPDSKIALDGSKLVAGDRMLDRQPILEPSYPKTRVVEVDLVTAEADRLADAQSVTKHRQNEQMIADSMAPVLGGVEQRGDFRFAQEILAPLMRVRGGHWDTFYISPAERGRRRHRNSADFLQRQDSTFYRMHLL